MGCKWLIRGQIFQLPTWRIVSVALLIARKCFTAQRISLRIAPHILPRGLSASTDTTFRPAGASPGRQLPSVRRNVPEVRRMTSPVPGRQPGMCLKPFT
jgi:hypothetical protein